MPQDTLMPSAPEAVVDALNSLMEAELNSIIRFMGEGSPYLSRASGEVRRPLQEMVQTNDRHCHELYEMIDELGGIPHDRGIQPEEQYLAFLSLKFLLPKLVDSQKLTISRYESALKAIGHGPDDVNAVLEGQLAEHRAGLRMLEKAAAQVAAEK